MRWRGAGGDWREGDAFGVWTPRDPGALSCARVSDPLRLLVAAVACGAVDGLPKGIALCTECNGLPTSNFPGLGEKWVRCARRPHMVHAAWTAALHAVALSSLLVGGYAHSTCAHESTARTTGGLDNTGYTFNRAVPYFDHSHHGRRLPSSSWQPIRISLDYSAGATTGQSQQLQTFLTDTLLPDAVAWIRSALSVVPVAGVLRHARFCGEVFSDGTCASEGSAPTCGVSSSGADYTVPTSLLDSLQTCTCPNSAGCTASPECSTAAAGAGVADSDFVLFVSMVSTASCSGSTLAYAATCHRDQNDRPIFGYVNFCPSRLSAAAADWEAQRGTAIHELLHALGFSSGSWPLFRDADGTPRTPRSANGLPARVSATCYDGVTYSNIMQVASSTLEVASERGTTVTRLVTPRVTAVARDVFGCSTLSGAELENQPTSASTCYGSHWYVPRLGTT